MSSLPGDANQSAPNDSQSRAAYREENNRLVLTNPLLRLALDSSNGTILSLCHRETDAELIDSQEAAEDGFLWRLEFEDPAGRPAALTSRDCAEFTHTLGRHRHQGALRLWLQWRGLSLASHTIEAALTAHISFPNDSCTVLFEAEIELPVGYTVRSLSFPHLCSVSSPDPLADDGLFFPISGGIFLPNPRSLARADEPPIWQAAYPGPASLQLLGYCCGDRTTLWLAAHDPHGARKSLAAAGMPSSARLRLWIAHHPTLRPDGHWSAAYPTAVGLAAGDWFEAARDYRAWAADRPWTAGGRGGERSIPTLTSAYGLWVSHWGGARRSVSAVRELQRLVNAPIKLDWRCWHDCARDGAYPDYLPPRDGDDAFAVAESQLVDAGVLDQVNINALLASRESLAWTEDQPEPYTFHPPEGEAGAPLDRPIKPPLALMCPGTDYWQHKLASIAREAAALGADGIYLEDLGSAGAALCREPSHDHGPPHPSQWTASLRSLLTSVRAAVGPGRQLATDGLAEPYLDLADAFFTDHAAIERAGIIPGEYGHRWIPIPLFASVYHDYTAIVGPGVSLGSHRPHDHLWPASAIGELRDPPSVMQRDYQLQFCLEVARAVTWGYQLLLENFSPEQTHDDSNRHKLAFLAAALRAQAWGVGALLPQSQFMGPLAIDCPTVEADILINPRNSAPADRRAVRRRLPTVHGSAWRVPGGGLTLVLVSISSQPTDFTARLRSSRLNPQLPLRLIGRTFSEDGDVPAASLRTSGTDVSGRLPGRTIALISLR
ncbi:MAG TPA: DUF6259 domain-containing protein [Armatimonadota bacterium]|nr:DUF6259 domain-containing protein [Armatimonadota bacterium]